MAQLWLDFANINSTNMQNITLVSMSMQSGVAFCSSSDREQL